MKSKYFLQLIIFSLCILYSNSVFAASVPADIARKWSENKGRELIDTLAEEDLHKKYEMLDDLFINHIDVDHIGKFVMGKYWRTMTNEQREIYLALFKRYSLALYKSYPLQFNKDNVDFSINKVQVENNYTLVLTIVTIKSLNKSKNPDAEEANVLVEFRLHEKDEKILLTDLKIAETSFLLVYRNRFAEMIEANDGDIEWFLEDLETITISNEKNVALIANNVEVYE